MKGFGFLVSANYAASKREPPKSLAEIRKIDAFFKLLSSVRQCYEMNILVHIILLIKMYFCNIFKFTWSSSNKCQRFNAESKIYLRILEESP